MEKFCVILHQVDRKIETTQTELDLEVDILFSRLKKIDVLELGITKVYLFTCKLNLFVLYVGYIIPFTGWNKRLKYIIEKMINEKCNEDIKISFTDHTYNTNDINSRRLRSLGGGIRRLVNISKKNSNGDNNDDSKDDSKRDSQSKEASFTTKEIFHSLDYYFIEVSNDKLDEKKLEKNKLDEKELVAQLYAVQYNKKLIHN